MITKDKAIDIVQMFDFFQGQRAGRELWQNKPFDVQEQDIKNFQRHCEELLEYLQADGKDTNVPSKWIPCSERLPEENGRYLCYSNNGRMEVYSFANDLYKVEYDFIDRRKKSRLLRLQ